MPNYKLHVVMKDDKRLVRDVSLDPSTKLMKLAELIVDSLDFKFDHMCGFYETKNDPYRGINSYTMFADQDDFDINIGEKPLSKAKVSDLWSDLGKVWTFVFDYGDDWQFTVELIGTDEPASTAPTIVKSTGILPEQYPEDDDSEDHMLGDDCVCPECEHEQFLQSMGINQYSASKCKSGIMVIVYLKFKDTYLALDLKPPAGVVLSEPGENALKTPIMMPLSASTSVESDIKSYLSSEFGLKISKLKGLAPLAYEIGEDQRLVALPYIVEVYTKAIKFDKKQFGTSIWASADSILMAEFGPLFYPLEIVVAALESERSYHPVY